MISKKMQDAINEQMKNEFHSSYIYLSMAAYFHHEGWDGMAHWMHKQAAEEKEHFQKFFDYLVEREGRVELLAIDKPKTAWDSPLAAFQNALEHEKFITARINELHELAVKENDKPTQILLQWYIEEQVEEEANASKIVQMLERVGDKGPGIFMLDAQLAKR
jgi:ferritin